MGANIGLRRMSPTANPPDFPKDFDRSTVKTISSTMFTNGMK